MSTANKAPSLRTKSAYGRPSEDLVRSWRGHVRTKSVRWNTGSKPLSSLSSLSSQGVLTNEYSDFTLGVFGKPGGREPLENRFPHRALRISGECTCVDGPEIQLIDRTESEVDAET